MNTVGSSEGNGVEPAAAPSSGSGYLTGLSSWMTTSSQPTENSSSATTSAAAGTTTKSATSTAVYPWDQLLHHTKLAPTAPKFSSYH